MKLSACGYVLPVRKVLIDLITSALQSKPKLDRAEMVVLNFRDPSYSPQTGGYHPVEIGIVDSRIVYITEFSYVGCGSFSELVIELDFEFKAGVFQQMGHHYPIERGVELFEMWQRNFCHYAGNGIYSVEVTCC